MSTSRTYAFFTHAVEQPFGLAFDASIVWLGFMITLEVFKSVVACVAIARSTVVRVALEGGHIVGHAG